MGLQKKERITYLKVTEGKLRQKGVKGDPGVEERFVEKTQKYAYEYVYTSCSGYIREVRTQEHEEYGVSYNIIIADPTDDGVNLFSLNMGEESRYFQAFAMILPNVDFSKPVEIKPYKFSKDGRDNIGLTISQDGNKLGNYYKEWDGEVSIPKNGYEAFDFAAVKNNKPKMKILRIEFMEWLKEEFSAQVRRLAEYTESNPVPALDEAAASVKTNAAVVDEGAEQEGEEEEKSTSKSSKAGKSKAASAKPTAADKKKNKKRDLPG